MRIRRTLSTLVIVLGTLTIHVTGQSTAGTPATSSNTDIPLDSTEPATSDAVSYPGTSTRVSTADQATATDDVGVTTTLVDDVTTQYLHDVTSSASSVPPEVCLPGFFGEACNYICSCYNLSEACDPTTGHCDSGCPFGFSGPGCLIDIGPDELSVVVFLSVLVAVSTLAFLFMSFYTLVYMPYQRRRRSELGSRAAVAYDYQEMAARMENSPVVELRPSVPRVSETDLQVMAEPLGQGRFGEILHGYLRHPHSQDNMEVAFKTIKGSATEEERASFVSQLELYSSIETHVHIIKFYGVCPVGDQVYAAFEYAQYGNLRDFLRQSTMPESQLDVGERATLTPRGRLLKFAYEVALGMRHLVRKRLIHRELCARHILLATGFEVKISGLNTQESAVHDQSIRWMAPESLSKGEFTVQSDIWSFGVLLWEIMTLGGKPYADVATQDLGPQLLTGLRMIKPEECDSDIYGLMRWCWHASPADRPTFLFLSNTMREMIDSGQVRLDLEDIDLDA